MRGDDQLSGIDLEDTQPITVIDAGPVNDPKPAPEPGPAPTDVRPSP